MSGVGARLQDHLKFRDDFEEQSKRHISGQFVPQQQASPKSQVLKTMDFLAPSSLTATAGGQGDVVLHK